MNRKVSAPTMLLGLVTIALIAATAYFAVTLRTTSGELADTRGELTSTTEVLSTTTAELESTSGDLADTRGDLASTTEVLSTTTGELESTSGELADTRGELASTTEVLSATTAELESASGELESTSGDLERTTKTLIATTGELAATQDELGSTAQQLEVTAKELDETAEDLEASSKELATTNEVLDKTTEDLSSTSRELETTTTELNSTRVDLTRTATQLSDVTHDLNNLQSRVGDLEAVETKVTELEILIAERTPLIPQTTISNLSCTGSMEPKLTCLDRARWLANYDPNDIVVGAVIAFTPSEDCNLTYTSALVSHRVIEIRTEGGLAFRTRGDNNFEDDGCWIVSEDIIGYITALYKNVRPEFAPLRDRVNAAHASLVSTRTAWVTARDEYEDYVSRYCPNYTCRTGTYNKASRLFNKVETARVEYEKAIAQYECKLEEAKSSGEIGFPVFKICGLPLLPN